MKSLRSPLSLAFNTSHEQLNPYHRFLGRIIHYLTIIHGVFYVNFFLQKQILIMKLGQSAVIIGIAALIMLDILATTALARVRRWSYRVFFITHLAIGITILPLLFFHATHLRTYVVESLFLFAYDLILRKIDTVQGYSSISPIPHTNLLKLVIPVSASKIRRFQQAPGQHVYLSIPPESIAKERASVVHDMLFNPFTVASVNTATSDITLVLRTLNGPTTTALNHLTKLSKAYPPLNIEGPYGSSRHFPNFAAEFDRVLLVAGGVGASFILPIYNHIQETLHQEAMSPSQLHLIWSMRDSAEAGWLEDKLTSPTEEEFQDRSQGASRDNERVKSSNPSPTAKGFAKSLKSGHQQSNSASKHQHQKQRLFEAPEDSNARVFVTGRYRDRRYGAGTNVPSDGSVELEELDGGKNNEDASDIFHKVERTRPDLARIVDSVFAHGNEERVAVLICGPEGMAEELKKEVGRWIGRGRDVWFWNEAFGW